jgi:hypothetical protein
MTTDGITSYAAAGSTGLDLDHLAEQLTPNVVEIVQVRAD